VVVDENKKAKGENNRLLIKSSICAAPNETGQ